MTDRQTRQVEQLHPLYQKWNEKINVISRSDLPHLYEHHVLHCLSIAKYVEFQKKSNVLDLGTGGGFPGIPLAILFPDTQFHLIDSKGKKVKVVQAISEVLSLSNVVAEQLRLGQDEATHLEQQFDFVVTRATDTLKRIYQWSSDLVRPGSVHTLENGILSLKGGDLSREIHKLNLEVDQFGLQEKIDRPFFEKKNLIHIPYSSFRY